MFMFPNDTRSANKTSRSQKFDGQVHDYLLDIITGEGSYIVRRTGRDFMHQQMVMKCFVRREKMGVCWEYDWQSLSVAQIVV